MTATKRRKQKEIAEPPKWLIPGAIVDYHARIGHEVTHPRMTVASEPWLLSDQWVVKLAGKAGGVAIEAVTLAGVDVAAARAVIAAAVAETGDSWTLGEPYSCSRMSTEPNVVDVLTEPEIGAPVFELCMIDSAKAAVAAFDPKSGWPAALDEIERLRAELAEARRG